MKNEIINYYFKKGFVFENEALFGKVNDYSVRIIDNNHTMTCFMKFHHRLMQEDEIIKELYKIETYGISYTFTTMTLRIDFAKKNL